MRIPCCFTLSSLKLHGLHVEQLAACDIKLLVAHGQLPGQLLWGAKFAAMLRSKWCPSQIPPFPPQTPSKASPKETTKAPKHVPYSKKPLKKSDLRLYILQRTFGLQTKTSLDPRALGEAACKAGGLTSRAFASRRGICWVALIVFL